MTSSEQQQLLSGLVKGSKVDLPDIGSDHGESVKFVRLEQPHLPVFSGEDKGDSNYTLWRHDVKCLIDDGSIPNSAKWQAIRKSLKGMAAGELVTLGEYPTTARLLEKFDALFGNTQSLEQVLQDLYLSKQEGTESISSWGYRLEVMIAKVQGFGKFSQNTCMEMLKSKFWVGLANEQVKSALRHKFDQGQSFEQLLKYARSVHLESADKYSKTTSVQQHQQTIDKLSSIINSLKGLDSRIAKLEKHDKASHDAPSSEMPKPSIICHHCGEPGHIRPDCPLAPKGKKKQKRPGYS